MEAYRSAYWDYYYRGNDLSRDRLDGAIGQLLAALSQEPNQPNRTGEYMLTISVDVEPDAIDGLIAKYKLNPFGFRFLGRVEDITGHWEPITHTKEKERI